MVTNVYLMWSFYSSLRHICASMITKGPVKEFNQWRVWTIRQYLSSTVCLYITVLPKRTFSFQVHSFLITTCSVGVAILLYFVAIIINKNHPYPINQSQDKHSWNKQPFINMGQLQCPSSFQSTVVRTTKLKDEINALILPHTTLSSLNTLPHLIQSPMKRRFSLKWIMLSLLLFIYI